MSERCECGHAFDRHVALDSECDCSGCRRVGDGVACLDYRPFKLGKWKHYKGGEYEVTGLRRHSENPKVMLVDYVNSSGEQWSRPLRTPPWDKDKKPYGWLDPLPDGTPRFSKVPPPPVEDSGFVDDDMGCND